MHQKEKKKCGSFTNVTQMCKTDFKIGTVTYSYASLFYTFKILKQLINKIAPEVCKVLIQSLSDCVRVSTCKINDWID